jgi:hypothetical protein
MTINDHLSAVGTFWRRLPIGVVVAFMICLIVFGGFIATVRFKQLGFKRPLRATLLGFAGVFGIFGLAALVIYVTVQINLRAGQRASPADEGKEAADRARHLASLTPEQLLTERESSLQQSLSNFKKSRGGWIQPDTFWEDLAADPTSRDGPVENPLTHSSKVVRWREGTSSDGWLYDLDSGAIRGIRPTTRPTTAPTTTPAMTPATPLRT